MAGLIESYDLTDDSGLNRENELRTKRRFDRCKTKGDEVVVINSFSGIVIFFNKFSMALVC